jgi:hypothetical protein
MWRWHLLLDIIMPSNRYLCCMVAFCACIISCLFYFKFSKDVFWGVWVVLKCNESITTMLLLPSLRTSWFFEGKRAPWNDDDEKVHEKYNNKTIMELWWIGTSIIINRIEKPKEEVKETKAIKPYFQKNKIIHYPYFIN